MKKSDQRFPRVPLAALLAGTLSASGVLAADQNPFALNDLGSGYKVVDAEGTGDNGDKVKKDGQCGSDKAKKANEAVCGIYQIGSSHKDPSKVKDGKCGGHKPVEALCGGDK